jgi:type IV pilus assembly protein PilQ
MRLKVRWLGLLWLLVSVALAAGAAGTPQLTDIGVFSRANYGAVITLHVSGGFTHAEYRPGDDMMIIDLHGVGVGTVDQTEQIFNLQGLRSYKVAPYSGEGGVPTVRLQINLDGSPTVKVTDIRDGLMIHVSPDLQAVPVVRPTTPPPAAEMPPAGTRPDAAAPAAAPAEGPGNLVMAPTFGSTGGSAPVASAPPRMPVPAMPPTRTPALAPSSRRAVITNIAVVQNAGVPEVEITVSEAVQPKVMRLDGPPRLVLDFMNATLAGKPRNIAVASGGVKAVRVGRFQEEPPITRVVIDLVESREFELSHSAGKLVVRLRPGLRGEADLNASRTLAMSQVGRGDGERELSESAESVSANAQAAPERPAEPSPEPVVIAAPAVAAPVSIPPEAVKSEAAAAAPAPLESASPVFTPSAPPSAATAPEPADPSALQAESAAVPDQPVKVAAAAVAPVPATPVAAPAATVLATITAAPVPPAPPVTMTAAAPAPQAPATTVAAAPQAPAEIAPAPVPPAPQALPHQPAVNFAAEQHQGVNEAIAPAQRFTGEPISVNLKDVDLKDFFRLIHEISGLNLVLDPNVSGSLTLVLDDVPWDQALQIVLKNHNLESELQGSVLRVATMDTLRKEAEARQKQSEAQALAVAKVTATRFLSYAHAKDVLPLLKRMLSPRGEMVADERTNALIISDIPSSIPRMDTLIAQLDRKTQEVEIEARVIAATRSFIRDLGTQVGFGWGNSSTAVGGAVSSSPNQVGYTSAPSYITSPIITNTGTTTAASIPLFSNLGATSPTSGLSLLNLGHNYRLDVVLTAAESRGLLKVLSRPRVITQNNVQAVVKQGQRIPITTSGQLGGPATTTYVDAVLRLTVTPQITAERSIFLNVDIENTQADLSTTVNGNPVFNTQQSTTQVLVTDGGTVVIGGVVQTQNTLSVQQVPLLGSMPGLGNLFKRRYTNTSTQELIFFITPKIVET